MGYAYRGVAHSKNNHNEPKDAPPGWCGSHLNTIQTRWCFSHGSILSDTKCHKQAINKQQTRNNQHFDYRGQGMAQF